MFKLILPKEADPRYIPRVSPHDDDMTDQDWNVAYGPVEIEGIDINVWNSNVYGSGPARGVVITGYAMSRDEDGFWDTATLQEPLFSADTNLDPEDWDDDWFGMSDDNTPVDVPSDVRYIVDNILKELSA